MKQDPPNSVRLVDPYGRSRLHIQKICPVCDLPFFVRQDYSDRVCCGVKCRGILYTRNRTVTKTCATCGKDCTKPLSKVKNSLHGVHFCSRICKDRGQTIKMGITAIHPPHYNTGETHYRMRALQTHGTVCDECGYNKTTRMLDVHHVDGDRGNDSVENLRVLCVWCHAEITRKDWPEIIL